MSQAHTLFIVDDNAEFRESACWWLSGAGYDVQAFDGPTPALKALRQWNLQRMGRTPSAEQPLACLLLDVRMPQMSGLDLHDVLSAEGIVIPVIYMTGHGDVPLAVQAMRAGAYDFLEKPFPSDQLLDSVRRALGLRRLVLENRSLRLALSDRQQLSARLVGQSPAMQRLREQIGALAATNADVLILGETGAGKEVVARALHDLSARRDGPFVAINAGALAESVVESELFGHEQGAFTGA